MEVQIKQESIDFDERWLSSISDESIKKELAFEGNAPSLVTDDELYPKLKTTTGNNYNYEEIKLEEFVIYKEYADRERKLSVEFAQCDQEHYANSGRYKEEKESLITLEFIPKVTKVLCKVISCSFNSTSEDILSDPEQSQTIYKPALADGMYFAPEKYSYKHSIVGGEKQETLDNKPYACDQCPFKTTLSHNLKSHKLVHSAVKPYICELCSYSCKRKCSLIIHMRKHTGETPLACDQCNLTFRDRNSLNSHKLEHVGEKPMLVTNVHLNVL